MSYTVSWDGPSAKEPNRGNEVAVSTVQELDLVLDRVHAQATAETLPYAVQIHRPGQHGAIMIGIGHPDLSFVDWLDRSQPHGSGNRYATDPDLPPASKAIAFDFYGDWTEMPPERTRITPERAREAARQYLRTGQQPDVQFSDRPSCAIRWGVESEFVVAASQFCKKACPAMRTCAGCSVRSPHVGLNRCLSRL